MFSWRGELTRKSKVRYKVEGAAVRREARGSQGRLGLSGVGAIVKVAIELDEQNQSS